MADLSFKVDYDVADALRNLQTLEGNTSKSAGAIEKAFRFQIVSRAVNGAFRYASEAVQLFAKDNERAQGIINNWDRAVQTVKRGIGQDLVEAMGAFTSDVESALGAVEKLRGGLTDVVAAGLKLAGGNGNGAADVATIRKAEADNLAMDRNLVQLRKVSEENKKAKEEAQRYIEANGDRIRQAAIFDEFDRREAELLDDAARKTAELQRLSKGISEDERQRLGIAERIRNVESTVQYELALNEAARTRAMMDAEQAEKDKALKQIEASERYYDLVTQNEVNLLGMKGNLYAKDAQRLAVQLKYEQMLRDVQRDTVIGEAERSRVMAEINRQQETELRLLERPEKKARREGSVSLSAGSLGSSLSLSQFFLGAAGSGAGSVVSEQKNTTKAVQEAGRTLAQIRQSLSGGGGGPVATAVLAP